MSKFLKFFVFFFCMAFALDTSAEISIKLSTGEIFFGEIVSIDERQTVVKTRYGTLVLENGVIVEKNEIGTEGGADVADSKPQGGGGADAPQKSAAKGDGHLPNSATASMSDSTFIGTITGSTEQRYLINADEWTGDYKEFVREYFPEGWMLKLRGGYSSVDGATVRDNLSLGFSLKKEWELWSFEISGYYDYAKDRKFTIDSAFVKKEYSEIAIDKYGLNGALKYKFLGRDSDWFLIYAPDFRVDVIKGIYPQVDNMLGVGYTVKNLDDYGIVADISAGFGPKYTYISKVDTAFGKFPFNYGFLMPSLYVRQNLTWKLHKTLSLEQKFRYSPDIRGLFWNGDLYDTDWESGEWMRYYSMYISLRLVYAPTDVLNLTLLYSYDFDKIGGSKGVEAESRFIFGIELPLGWSK